ncbi:MAG: hypothetical protein M0P69_11005 [Bacteroidales bacterium]|nr:hypothetical protein [Bacteroidales bacterium]
MSDRIWKTVDALHVDGASIRAIPVKDNHGKLTPWTPSIIEKIYNKIKGPLPLYIKHDERALFRQPVGYGIKFGITEDHTDITYNGFVFDDGAIKQIIEEGYNCISPEVENEYDEQGELVDSTLLAMAFVKNPSFPGMQVQYAKAAFSESQNDELASKTGEPMSKAVAIDTLKSKGLSETEIASITQAFESAEPAKQEAPSQQQAPPVQSTPAAHVEQKSAPPAAPDMSAFEQRLAEQATVIAQLQQKNEDLLKTQYNTVRDEVRGLGIANPDDIVKGLPTEQKISILSKMKENMARNQPMSTPAGQPVSSQSQPVDQRAKMAATLKSIGMTVEEYEKLKLKK